MLRRASAEPQASPQVGLGESRMEIQGCSLAPWPRVSVIIPTLNEARNLPHVFRALPSGIYEIIVVDGYSVDDTLAVVRKLRPDARIVMQTRSGKGNALACGCAAATGDIIAMIDADGSTDAGEIPSFVSALLDGADFAKGTRFAKGGNSEDITRLRGLGNRILTGLVNLLYGTRYTDLCYGFNVFWQKHFPALGFNATAMSSSSKRGCTWGDGFEIETLINIRIAVANLAVTEVPSLERSRIHGVSNLNAFSDGIRVLRTILYERFVVPRRRRRFPARRFLIRLSARGAIASGHCRPILGDHGLRCRSERGQAVKHSQEDPVRGPAVDPASEVSPGRLSNNSQFWHGSRRSSGAR
jgi:glycosyltransferase involved in cell wall biosynthesis